MVFQAEALTRRGLFTWRSRERSCFCSASRPPAPESSDLAKAAAWRIGDQLSLAGLLYAQGGQEDNVEQLLSSTKPLAEAMEIEIKPFPPRAATPTETYAEMIHYLIKGDGAEIGREIAGNSAMTPARSTRSRSNPICCSCSMSRATTRASAG